MEYHWNWCHRWKNNYDIDNLTKNKTINLSDDKYVWERLKKMEKNFYTTKNAIWT